MCSTSLSISSWMLMIIIISTFLFDSDESKNSFCINLPSSVFPYSSSDEPSASIVLPTKKSQKTARTICRTERGWRRCLERRDDRVGILWQWWWRSGVETTTRLGWQWS
uniref:Uncharacterized protein n=1 Tax=Aegilops tauschii subsp. strangulata TaxID=200361 RepID=A0A453QZ43_AEGTS